MINPDLRESLKNKTSRYSLVTAVAKRARMIVDESLSDGIVVEEKPVSLAVGELSADEWSVVKD